MTIERMCTLAAVSRASYYRDGVPKPDADEEESRLRDAIQRAALDSRQYGYRRITHALRAEGWKVNHKRVARLMRQDNLLAIRKRRFVPQTTNSEHDFDVAINVARRLTPTAMNQLWVADLTYVRLGCVDVFRGGCHGCVFAQDRGLEPWAKAHNRPCANGIKQCD